MFSKKISEEISLFEEKAIDYFYKIFETSLINIIKGEHNEGRNYDNYSVILRKKFSKKAKDYQKIDILILILLMKKLYKF
jgi:hypothetical protein